MIHHALVEHGRSWVASLLGIKRNDRSGRRARVLIIEIRFTIRSHIPRLVTLAAGLGSLDFDLLVTHRLACVYVWQKNTCLFVVQDETQFANELV